jgi:hypothetical protein
MVEAMSERAAARKFGICRLPINGQYFYWIVQRCNIQVR